MRYIFVNKRYNPDRSSYGRGNFLRIGHSHYFVGLVSEYRQTIRIYICFLYYVDKLLSSKRVYYICS